MNHRGAPAPELIDARDLRAGEELRISIEPYRGHTYLSIRRWWKDGNVWKPGKGATLRIGVLPWLRRALEAAERRALELGVLAEEDFELAGRPLPPELGGELAPAPRWLPQLLAHLDSAAADVADGGVLVVEVRHDEGCGHFDGRPCDCDAAILSRRATG